MTYSPWLEADHCALHVYVFSVFFVFFWQFQILKGTKEKLVRQNGASALQMYYTKLPCDKDMLHLPWFSPRATSHTRKHTQTQAHTQTHLRHMHTHMRIPRILLIDLWRFILQKHIDPHELDGIWWFCIFMINIYYILHKTGNNQKLEHDSKTGGDQQFFVLLHHKLNWSNGLLILTSMQGGKGQC